VNVLVELRAETCTVSERAYGQHIHSTGGLTEPVRWFNEISWILGHCLFKAIAAPWNPVSGRDDDNCVKLARQLIQRCGPRTELTSIVGALRIAKCNHEQPTTEAPVKRSERLAHLRRD
jgi:hypothetical protein